MAKGNKNQQSGGGGGSSYGVQFQESDNTSKRDQAKKLAIRAMDAVTNGNLDAAKKLLARSQEISSGIQGNQGGVLAAIKQAKQAVNNPRGFTASQSTATQAPAAGSGGGEGGGSGETPASPNADMVKWLQNELSNLGIGLLAADVNALVLKYGTNTAMYQSAIRQTQSYIDRFQGFITLQSSGDNKGIIDEGDWRKFENSYAQAFDDAGLRNMVRNPDGTLKYKEISKIVNDYGTSVDEVKSRIADAQRIVNDTDPQVKDAFKRYYNIDSTDLLAYSLDPTNGAAELNRKANAAIFAGLAEKTGTFSGIGEQFASRQMEQLAGTGLNAQDVNRQALQESVNAAAETFQGTQRLAQLEGGALSQEETLSAQLNTDLASKQKIEKLKSQERARFGGTSGLQRSTLRSRGV